MPQPTPLIFRAIEFAAAAHAGQYRKGTPVPYIVHPLNAARMLLMAGCEEHVAAAAVLHDVIEDTHVSFEDVKAHFGERVAELVANASEPDRLATWEERKRHTIAFLEGADEETLLVAVADKLDNIRSIREDLALRGDVAWTRFKRGRAEQMWYYQSLERVFRARFNGGVGHCLAESFSIEVAAVFGGEAR
ncbi:MAG TPA: HD domain-containing protein [Bryobacteraceae bacterium]|nr:HD domain-containing protein [Bryobacteraceae bacterium]